MQKEKLVRLILLNTLFLYLTLCACSVSGGVETNVEQSDQKDSAADDGAGAQSGARAPEEIPEEGVGTGLETATLGAGCFWCVEAVLEQLDGIVDVRSGYMGGPVENPTYRAVCSGETGHAEVVQVDFDPGVMPYADLLSWFWRLHDPTTLNRQGADEGTQYRSAIYFHSEAQRVAATASLASAQGGFGAPIVTEITAAEAFYPAEDYHQDYYRGNKRQGYCRMVIAPKLEKLNLDQ